MLLNYLLDVLSGITIAVIIALYKKPEKIKRVLSNLNYLIEKNLKVKRINLFYNIIIILNVADNFYRLPYYLTLSNWQKWFQLFSCSLSLIAALLLVTFYYFIFKKYSRYRKSGQIPNN